MCVCLSVGLCVLTEEDEASSESSDEDSDWDDDDEDDEGSEGGGGLDVRVCPPSECLNSTANYTHSIKHHVL